jgi:isoaspartyl peptidase/L-asparaginase-like protein (Ntn-hydrolase superfamily)
MIFWILLSLALFDSNNLVSVFSTGMILASSSTPRKSFTPAAAGAWDFSSIAISEARQILESGGSSVDAVEQGIRAVELNNDDQYFVGSRRISQ